jgi:hypothetical protein
MFLLQNPDTLLGWVDQMTRHLRFGWVAPLGVADSGEFSMHYERAPRFRRLRPDVAPPPLRCVGLCSATAALKSNCGSVSGAKGLQESIGKSAGEWHFTLRERQAWTRMSFPPRGQLT